MNYKTLSLIATILTVGTAALINNSATTATNPDFREDISQEKQDTEKTTTKPNSIDYNEGTIEEKPDNNEDYLSSLGDSLDKITKIYRHQWQDLSAATLYVRNIPVLTFLGNTKATTSTSSNQTELVDMTNVKTYGSNKSVSGPILRATKVALQLDRFSQSDFNAENIKVSWNEKNKSYSIKINDRELVAINDKTILPDSTKNLAEDALQATNRLRRLMGNASPLKKIIGLPASTPKAQRSVIATVIPNLRVIREIAGQASWYGPGFHGRTTANGERYDQYGLTAAHRNLPFGTKLRVTNMNNGRSVVVRVNDRGPYVGGRVVDLSAGAANVIGMTGSGVAPVKVEVLGR